MYLYIDQIDHELKHYLSLIKKPGLIGEVHSVYDRVVNIHMETEDRFITIASNDIIQSPDMMKTEDNVNFKSWSLSLKHSKKVFLIGYNQLSIGKYIIDFEKAITRKAKIHKLSFTSNNLEKAINTIDLFLDKNGKKEGILTAYQHVFNQRKDNSNNKLTIHQRALIDRLTLLEQSFDLKQLKSLIGLGVGLTPSGDDFLMGLLTVLQAYDNYLIKELTREKEVWLSFMKQRTTIVSYYMLKHCINGLTNEALKQLLINFKNINEKEMLNVLNIGSTSGTDMLVGVVTGYRLLIKSYL